MSLDTHHVSAFDGRHAEECLATNRLQSAFRSIGRSRRIAMPRFKAVRARLVAGFKHAAELVFSFDLEQIVVNHIDRSFPRLVGVVGTNEDGIADDRGLTR